MVGGLWSREKRLESILLPPFEDRHWHHRGHLLHKPDLEQTLWRPEWGSPPAHSMLQYGLGLSRGRDRIGMTMNDLPPVIFTPKYSRDPKRKYVMSSVPPILDW